MERQESESLEDAVMLANLVYTVVSNERLCLKQGRGWRLARGVPPPTHMCTCTAEILLGRNTREFHTAATLAVNAWDEVISYRFEFNSFLT